MESFDLFGERIAIIHAKISWWRQHLTQLRTGGGRGELHYGVLMDCLKARKPGSASCWRSQRGDAEECVAYLRSFCPG